MHGPSTRSPLALENLYVWPLNSNSIPSQPEKGDDIAPPTTVQTTLNRSLDDIGRSTASTSSRQKSVIPVVTALCVPPSAYRFGHTRRCHGTILSESIPSAPSDHMAGE